MTNKRITIARGDGIGPEIMDATLRILEAAKAPLEYDEIKVGKAVYESGHSAGIGPDTWDTILKNKVLLKAPITTPLGGGYKSLNVTIRKTLNLYANVRPTKSYSPFVFSQYPKIDLVIVRENEEDLYAGIEHQQTNEVAQVLKLITRPGSERIARYAFEYARAYGRKRVTCMTKDNIMKLTDGLFHKVFESVAKEYPEIEAEHQIVDIGAANVAAKPESFDVILAPNLYGDILSDIASQVAGSVGLAGSANIGANVAMFEAVHGSAPDIAGKGIANPSGLLLGAEQMLVHMDESETAALIKNAWLATLESGIHTGDLYRSDLSKTRANTKEFTKAVIDRLGEKPKELKPVSYKGGQLKVAVRDVAPSEKRLVGIDVFLDWTKSKRDPNVLGPELGTSAPESWRLKMITNRGVKVFPDGLSETFCTDHWRCRFVAKAESAEINYSHVLELMTALHGDGFDIIKTENLYTFDGKRGYSLGQGE